MNFAFFTQSILYGMGLAADATAVSMANGMNEPKMRVSKAFIIAFMFGFFQALMPLIGYFIGHSLLEYIDKFIPWIALILLGFIGTKMIIDGVKPEENTEAVSLTARALFVQAIATSIDALSTGITIANYKISEALVWALIVMVVTMIMSFAAVFIGKKFGTKLGHKAEIIGGIILIGIGLNIFIQGVFF